jgi:hypothetical protein
VDILRRTVDLVRRAGRRAAAFLAKTGGILEMV